MSSDSLYHPWVCSCPYCSLTFQTKTFFQGRLCRCPHCAQSFTLPLNPPSLEELKKGSGLCQNPANFSQEAAPALCEQAQKQRRRIRKRIQSTQAPTKNQTRNKFFILGSFFLFLAGCLFLVFVYNHYRPTQVLQNLEKKQLFEHKPLNTKPSPKSPSPNINGNATILPLLPPSPTLSTP